MGVAPIPSKKVWAQREALHQLADCSGALVSSSERETLALEAVMRNQPRQRGSCAELFRTPHRLGPKAAETSGYRASTTCQPLCQGLLSFCYTEPSTLQRKRNHLPGVSTVAQGDQWHLSSPRTQVQSLAWYSGLRIWHCWGAGPIWGVDLIPGWGAPLDLHMPQGG